MFREIRRKKNAISIDSAKELLRTSRRGVLSVQGENGYPYALPINYLYEEETQTILFHGAKTGHKVDALKACDKVCFTVVGNERIQEEPWAPFVQSVIVFGRCHLVEDRERSIALVRRLAGKYYPDEAMAEEEIRLSGKHVQMFELKIEHLSGKEVQEK